MDENAQNIIVEYKLKQILYLEFSNTFTSLLENILKHSNYKYQISRRIKKLGGLKEKIERKKQKGIVYKALTDIEDIVGIRIIFYTEADRGKFIKRLSKEFVREIEVDETSKISGYSAMHVILCFGENRLKLGEYKKFRGLKAELQLTLILDHAWAEIEHDILYKQDTELLGKNKCAHLRLKERMGKIMNNHIRQASSELEDIMIEIKKN